VHTGEIYLREVNMNRGREIQNKGRRPSVGYFGQSPNVTC